LLGFAGIAWFAPLAANRGVIRIRTRGGIPSRTPGIKTVRVKVAKAKTPEIKSKASNLIHPPGNPRVLSVARCRGRDAADAR
jgi:hypothetical protein